MGREKLHKPVKPEIDPVPMTRLAVVEIACDGYSVMAGEIKVPDSEAAGIDLDTLVIQLHDLVHSLHEEIARRGKVS